VTGTQTLEGFTRAELELALDAGRAGTFRIEADTRAVRWSRSLAAIMGVDPADAPATYEEALAFVHPDDRGRLQSAVAATIEDGAPYELELRVVHPDGAVRWLAVQGRPAADAEGGRRTLVGIARDLERDRALLEDRALLDGIFAAAPTGLAFVDTDLRYVRVNAALARMDGHAVDEHLGRRPRDLLGPRAEPIEDALRAVLAGGEPCEVRVDADTPAAPGALRAFVASFFAVRGTGDEVVGAGILVRDVTDAADAERARERLLTQTRLLAEVSAALDASLDYDRTLAAVADLAVRSIADWCAIDLPTEDGGLRNVAVAHADAAKVQFARRAIERYPPDPRSPTGAANVLRTGQPELYREIPEELLRAGAQDEEHLRLILSLRATSAMVVPLRARGRTLGALTLIRTGGGAPYTEEDLAFAQDVAGRAALAVDDARMYRDARAQRDLYEALLQSQSELGEAFVLIDGERIEFVTEAAERMLQMSTADILALRSFWDVVPEDQHRAVGQRIARIVSDEDIEPGFQTEIVRTDGTRVPVEVAAKALKGDGEVRLAVIVRDVTERRQQEAERERLLEVEQAARRASEAAHARVRLLADASALLERSLSLDATAQEVAELVVAQLAGACAIDVVDRIGVLRRVAADARSPEATSALWRLGREQPPAVASEHPVARAVRSAQAIFPDGDDDGSAGLRDALGPSAVIVPLVARGRSLGTLSLGWPEQRGRPPREEWSLIEALAQRIALAVDNAQQYRERAQIARTLQASLLPRSLPLMAGAEVAAEYVAAGEGMDVGGDFYDVFDLGPGVWALVIGDVCGKGAEAAAVTALARYTLRALAGSDDRPAATLARLNDELLRQAPEPRFLSAVLCRLALAAEGPARLQLACGGHPAPVVLRARGGARALACGGQLLGIHPGGAAGEADMELEPGDAIVLYTDGITEADRRRPLTAEGLAAALSPLGGAEAATVARAVIGTAEQRARGPLPDDAAVLVVRITGP
jgi:PAS domain S-box-containing protein